MDGVGVLLAVEAPAAQLHEVVDVVDVELVRREAEQERGVAHDPQLGVRAHGGDHLVGGLEDLLGVLQVALAAQLHHRGPRGGEQAAAARPVHRRRAVLSTGPLGLVEVLAPTKRRVAERHHGRALQAVAVLVGVRAHRGDARQAVVEHLERVAQLLAEGQDEPAQAAVDVQADAALDRQLGHLADRVDRAVAVVAGRADDRHGVLVDLGAHRSHVGLGAHRVDRHVPLLEAEQLGRLAERRVGGLGLHDVGVGDPPRPAGLAVGEDRVGDRRGAARGDDAHRRAVGDRVGMEQVERHGDDLALEAGGRRADVALQRVDVGEERERLVEKLVVVVVAAIHRARHLAVLPGGVLLGGQGAQLVDDLTRVPALLRKGAVDGETIGVGVGAHEC